jgi:hypothetical protein
MRTAVMDISEAASPLPLRLSEAISVKVVFERLAFKMASRVRRRRPSGGWRMV